MSSFWDRLKESFRRLRGGGNTPSEPQPQPVEQEYETQEEVPEEELPPQEEHIDRVYYEPGYNYPGTHISVKPRYSIGSMECTDDLDMDDVRDLFRTVGFRNYYVIVVTGHPCNEYPGKEGEETITLSYSREGNTALDVVDQLWPDATTFANAINSQEPLRYLDCWEYVCKISLLDMLPGVQV